jgi:hypothetical protein
MKADGNGMFLNLYFATTRALKIRQSLPNEILEI